MCATETSVYNWWLDFDVDVTLYLNFFYFADSTCSQMLSLEEFEAQKVEFTQNQIAELAKFVAADTSVLPSRKKKDFLKKLQASHPSAYATLRQPLKASHQLFASSVESSKKILKVSGTGALTRRRSKK